ncbi:hypothetical protein QJQ45_003612 [Haematococcus lacustris]|nr:hypothetical protein QJQ45_003612 [Haematococcus lacustris]
MSWPSMIPTLALPGYFERCRIFLRLRFSLRIRFFLHCKPGRHANCEGLEALPPVGKEYQQGYKLVHDRLPKGKQRLHRAAEYHRGIDGRARNNA